MRNLYLEIRRKLKNRELVFWILVFPLLLSTLFRLILSGAYTASGSSPRVAIENSQNDPLLSSILTDAGVEIVSAEKSDAILTIHDDGSITMRVQDNGTAQTLIATIVNQYEDQKALGMPIASTTKLDIQDTSSSQNIVYINYYTSLVMGCLSSAYFGLKAIRELMPAQSELGKRLAIAPLKKRELITLQLISNLVICIILNCLQILFMSLVLKIDFGSHYLFVLLTTFIGSGLGNGLGLLVGTLTRQSYNDQSTLLTAIIMLLNTASGMLIPHIKVIIQTHAPLLDMLNPASLLTNAYYELSFYGTTSRYFLQLLLLLCFIALCYGLTLYFLRRHTYADL